MTRARTALLIVILLLTVGVVSLAGVSIQRKVAAFQPLGFRAEAQGAVWWVSEVDSADTGLLAGDQVLLADQLELADLGRLRERAASELTVLRGAEVIQVTYQRPPLAVDFAYLALVLTGAAYLLIGLFTLVKDRRSQSLLFYLWCLLSAVLCLYSPIGGRPDLLGQGIYFFEEAARLLLPPVTLHLFLVFPTRMSLRPGFRRLVPFLYLPGAVLATLLGNLILFPVSGGLFARPAHALATLDRLEVAHLVVFALLSLGLLVERLRRSQKGEAHRQTLWVTIGLGAGYLPFVGFYFVPWLLGYGGSQVLHVLATLPLALVPLTFAYAILRYKLWDIGIIVRDTITATLTVLLGILGFSLMHLAVTRGLPENLGLMRNLLSFAGGLTIAGLLVPMRRSIASGIEHLQYRGDFGKRRALVELADELLYDRDLDRLCSRLLDQLEESISLLRANLYLAEGEWMIPVRPDARSPRRVRLEDLGERLWSEPVRSVSGATLPLGDLGPETQLFKAGYRYAFPLVVRSHRIGLLLCSYKDEETPLNSEDLETLRTLLNQAALAIENAQLMDELRHQLDEVLRLQEYSEGVIQSSPAGIAVLDPSGRVLSANLAFAALAAKERSDVLGKALWEMLPVYPLPEPGDGLIDVSYCTLRDRAEHHFQVSCAPFSAAQGEPLRILVAHDVSERVAMENALRKKDRLAALGMLAAGVAHEVNTPITGISSYAQMLLSDTPPDDPRHEVLKKVERQTFRASRIVNNLLEFARNRSGELGSVDLALLVEETLDLLRDRLSKGGIRLEWSPPAVPMTVEGNDGELQQVLTNLLLNACDAMGGNGGILTVSCERDEGRVRVTVGDTGEGIPEDRLERIFEPFFTTKISSGGTGLGLAISQEIVVRHGGTLRAESEPGQGARFIVEIPGLDEDG